MKYVGMDVHRSYCQVAVLETETGVLEELRIESTPEGLRAAVLGIGLESRVALEASSHWGWVVDELQGMGLDVVLSHPTKTKAIGSARIKTDKIDAKMLAHLLAADLLPEAHIASQEVRELRSYLRYRWVLVQMRTMAKNRVHAILAGYGLKSPARDLFCLKGREWLSRQVLGELHREQVNGYLEVIDLLSGLTKRVDERIRPMAEQHREAKLLMSVSGISYYSALLIVVEIDGVERFYSSKHLTSYAGLCPSTYSSGGRERHGRITKCGSSFLRWILVEAAQQSVYPRSPLHGFYLKIARKKGHSTAKVAVARKLLESIYQMLKRGMEFDPRVWMEEKRGIVSADA